MSTAPNTVGLPDASQAYFDPKTGQPMPEFYKWCVAADRALRSLVTTSATALTSAGGATLTGGFQEEPFDLGTPANNSTVTPNPSDGLYQEVTNNVNSLTIAATAQVGAVMLVLTNGASAGTPALSGFTKTLTGDSFDSVSGHKWLVIIYGLPGASAVVVKALF